MRKTVVFLNSNLSGGAEKITNLYAESLPSEQFNVIIIIAGRKNPTKKSNGSNTIFYKIPSFKFSFFILYKILKKFNPDYVFTSLHGIAFPLLVANILYGKTTKIVIRQSFSPERFSKYSLTTLQIKYFYNRAYGIIAQTSDMKISMMHYYKLKPDLIRVINNPLNFNLINDGIKSANPFKNISDNKFVVIGNIRYVKGYDILIQSFNKLLSMKSNSMLFIIGKYDKKDKYYKSLLKYLNDNNLNTKVVFTNFSNNPYKYIYNSDCLVLPSRSEGLPNVLIEALYLKKPVVATTCIPMIEKLIVDGVNGYKVQVENVTELALSMLRALDLNVKQINSYQPASNEEITSIFNWIESGETIS